MNLFDEYKAIFAVMFCIYQFWAYKRKKKLGAKILPLLILPIIGLLLMAITPNIGSGMGFLFIFVILIVELFLIGAMLLIVIEIILSLVSPSRSFYKVFKLVGLLIIIIVIYYFGQRVF